ncbi:hypothetical protein ES319_D10G285500v1 [Gossypium barbadense]|uniref:Uncharacterized protein n=2 Tax=Gossypium TaxID=3633 RepID=A0A5J5PWL1_GOSBA|nr:hypothetical protein ES319_D10G285500v1 [Gossypium barbadense]PPD76983.1 hypothetical protein GOBAR_DD26083 [Gossypium barbadense]TYG51969.1 hypothetical protein ES288_D10G304000v1 [Gossypium darwinii]
MSPGHIPSLRINNNNSITSFSLLMVVFLALINLKFQPLRNIESPFETQGVVMPMFVICMLVYSITFCTPNFPEVIDHINLLAGSLATVLLTFTLFPPLGRVILFIWTIHFVKLIYGAIPKLCQLCQALPSLFNLRVLLGRHAHHNEERCCNSHIHASLGFLISVLVDLIQVKYQSTNMAVPFETHPAIMFIFITAILVYAAAATIKTSNDNSSIHRVIVTKISLLSGSLATVVLLLVIVAPIGWFILLIWTFFLVKQIYYGCQMLRQPYRIISVVYYVIYQIFGRRRDMSQGRNRLSLFMI